MFNKVAILIDGGFYKQRFKHINNKWPVRSDIVQFIQATLQKVQAKNNTGTKDILFRSFYYDCRPFGGKQTDPAGNTVDFSSSPTSKASNAFLDDLMNIDQLAIRLGELSFDGWKYSEHSNSGYQADFKQKSVDMKIGLDIAWISSKSIVDKLVLVTGDSDFVAPMKFARREGLLVYLESMGQAKIKRALKEHADFVL
jgi:uncharacterized LabA/DUF88 family protein